MVVGFLVVPYVTASVANASLLSTSGPITSIEMSNSTITEQGGQLFLFDATNIAGSNATTGITTTFATGTASWVNGASSGSFTSGVAASVPLTRGYNTIIITHTAGSTNTEYKIFVTRGGHWTGFTINTPNVTITPAFSPDVRNYTLSNVPYSVTSLRYVVTETFNQDGRLTCNSCDWWQFNSRGELTLPLTAGDNTINWSYYPESQYGGVTENYTFTIRRAAAFDANTLSNLTLSNSTLTEQSGQLYRFNGTDISSSTATTGVTATFATGTARWTNGSNTGLMTSGIAASVPLTRGYNTIEVAHTAGGTTTTYRVYVTRGGQWTGFTINTPNVTITPAFDPDVHYYTLSDVPYSVTSLRYVITETFNQDGRLTCTGCDWWQFNSRGEVNIPLSAGSSCIDWSYYPEAQYGGTTVRYYFAINRNAPGAPPTGQCVMPAATTTTTSPPTTTAPTTTVPRTTTTLAPVSTTTTTVSTATTTTVVNNGSGTGSGGSGTVSTTPTQTVPQGQAAVATIAPTAVTTAPALAPLGSVPVQVASTTTTTTTTLPAEVTPVATPNTPAPTVAALEIGKAGMTVDGKTLDVAVSRADNQVIVSGGGVTMTMSVLSVNGERVPLDSAGGLRFNTGDKVVMSSEGLSPGDEMTFWMFSTPTALGTVKVGADGIAAGTFAIPSGLEKGGHRLVLQGLNKDGKKIVLGVGVGVGKIDSSSTTSRLLIAIPVALAIGLGIALPNQARRRRRKLQATA
jgi:hypothetical protein